MLKKTKYLTKFFLLGFLAMTVLTVEASATGREKYEVGNYQKVLAEQKFNLAGLLEYEGKYAQAVKIYDEVVAMCPNMATAYTRRGTAYMHQDDYVPAIADLTKAIELNPRDDEAYLNRALIYGYREEYDLAIADYTKMLNHTPDDLTYVNRGVMYKKKGDYERAAADWREALKINAKCVAARENLGNLTAENTKAEK